MIDDRLLISLVKRNPSLYDKGVVDFKNQAKKAAVWKNIADILSTSVEKVQTRWITLRTLFCRELRVRKRQGNNTPDSNQEVARRGWPLFDLMMFIKPYQRAKTPNGKEFSPVIASVETPSKLWVDSRQWNADELGTPEEIESSNDVNNRSYVTSEAIPSASSVQLKFLPEESLKEKTRENSKMEDIFFETTGLMKETLALLSSHQNKEADPNTVPDAEVAAIVKVLQYPLQRVSPHLRTICLTELLTVVHKYEENSS